MTRKIKSREYCHWCDKTSEWVFEDKAENQIIICPECGHKHYRIITGQLVRPEIKYKGEIIDNVEEFLKKNPRLRKKFQEIEEEVEMRFEVSGARWGQDPAQGSGLSYNYTSTGTGTVYMTNSSATDTTYYAYGDVTTA